MGPHYTVRDPGLPPPRPDYTEEQIWEPLSDLYGLAGAKAQARRFISFARVQERRRELDFPCPAPVLHMCFTGEPGTGKTEFARRLSTVLYRAGLLPVPGVVEVSRRDLVDRFIGHTAQRTAGVLAEARGRVLLIDEAYSIVRERDDRRDFGHEALATLVKAMEDQRDQFCCILTGYETEMQEFLDINSGLRSRIGFFLRFPTYAADDLLAIGHLLAGRWGVVFTPAAGETLHRALTIRQQDQSLGRWGNARLVRHLVEKAVMAQADRLVQAGLIQASRIDLKLLQAQDVEAALAMHFEGDAGGQQ